MTIPKCVLVTGASGFIGQHVVSYLLTHGVERIVAVKRIQSFGPVVDVDGFYPGEIRDKRVRYIYGDLVNNEFVRNVTLCFKPDVIMHLASNPIVRLDSNSRPGDIIDDNITTTANLLANAPQDCVFINASSAMVYGNQVSQTGRTVMEYFGVQPNTVYGATKAASEHLINAYRAMGRIQSVNLRLVANVGPGATHGVVKDIVRKLYLPTPTLELLGDWPGSEKPFIHVNDTAQAFCLAATSPRWRAEEAVNLSSKTKMSVECIANIAMCETGIQKPIVWLGEAANWKGDNRSVQISSTLASTLGWRPRYSHSDDAVRQAVKEIILSGELECQKAS